VAESGVTCPRCGDGRCVRRHARRYRKRVKDLSSGEVHKNLPILRVRFCEGPTRSLMPAELWRGRYTTSSILETVALSEREGLEAALDWASYAGEGETPVSERTLIRWRALVRSRLVGSALVLLSGRLSLYWSDQADLGAQLETLLDRLRPLELLALRAHSGHALLDKPSRPQRSSRSSSRRVPGRLAPSPPPDPSSAPLPRGSRLARSGRSPPRRTQEGVDR
jgi:hypothetical protein